MSYSNFTNLELKERFGIEQCFRANLFAHVPPRPVSDWLKSGLERNLSFALAQGTEKARSEFIIAPVFAELRDQSDAKVSVFSGWEFDVDRKRGLSGFCDFLVSRSSYQAALEAPVVTVVEAKREDFERGLTQCGAEMVAARLYNERRKSPVATIHGCVTTGDVWRFLTLRENLVEIDIRSFDISTELERIFGIVWAMAFDEVLVPA